MPIMHSVYRESGTVTIDREACKECGACARICPSEVLRLDNGSVQVCRSAFDCIACGHCMMVCPEGAVTVTGRGISPDDLLPLPPQEERANAEQLTALMLSRRSVRRFSDRDVEPELLERVVEMASTAPMGIPPWDVGCVTIRGREEVQRLAGKIVKDYEGFLKIFWLFKIMGLFWGKAKRDMFTHFVRPLAETYVRGRREGRDHLFYDAPAVLIFHHSPYADAVDATIACTYAMLAAESLGLGTTMIGGAPPILARNKALSRSLGIPDDHTPTISLIVGHPATHFRRAIRRRFVS
ncbi:MAG: 4Fe-4S binding protein [Planctomycetaceae bacterium]|nr:4Fe-4S binding protein [Planctomycetaceae bacterium]